MTTYEIVLFVHVVAVIGMFVGIGINNGIVIFARRAQDVSTVRAVTSFGKPFGMSIPVFAIATLLSGIYLVEEVWEWEHAWINLSLGLFIVELAAGNLINERRMKAIGKEAATSPDGPLPPSLREKLHDPVLHAAEFTMTFATLGIVYLMTVKPGTTGSLLALGVAIAIGAAVSAALAPRGLRPAER